MAIARHGAGTERVERLLAGLAERFPVFRLDSDTAGAGSHARILSDFERAPAGVLVGTQMVAKGHDFPDVVLGVVLDADATLRFPDFRAEERTFALVAQLAGRVGRGERGGWVLVQTLAPGADPLRLAAAGDASGFLAGELERRAALSYPPFSHLVRIELAAAVASAPRPPRAASPRRSARRFPVTPSCWARRLGSGCAGVIGASSWSSRPSGPPPWRRSGRRSSGLPVNEASET